MLTIKELRHMDLLSKSASMAEAASRGGVTQSAISQSLSGVEQKLGVQLFIRGRNAVTPTRFGEVLVSRARRILNELDRLSLDIDAMKQDHLGTIRFGIGPAVADLMLVEVLTELAGGQPAAVPRFRVKLWDDSEQALLDGDIDLFIGGFPRDVADPRFEMQPFYRDTLVAIARGEHPLSQREGLRFADIVHYPVLTQESRHFALWRTLESLSDLELFALNVPGSLMANPLEALPALRTTDHVLICTRANWLKVRPAHPELAELPVADLRGTSHMNFVFLAGRGLDPAQRALVDAFRRVGDRLFRELGIT